MNKLQIFRSALVGGASVLAIANPAAAKVFDIPGGDLAAALDTYMQQSGAQIFFVQDVVRGHRTGGAKGDYSETAALTQVLRGTGFTIQAVPSSNFINIVPQQNAPAQMKVAQVSKAAAPPPQQTGLETVVVTAQKRNEDIQTVPIAITALSQQQLTERQVAGGPDLVKEVPNLTFSKTNFTGYNLEIRGIGTQAISVTTDPAVAVAFNGIPFIRNHFFEQEFFDLDNVQVLRGPQGTLYGRNATAGVVNLVSALPTDQFEAMTSVDIGNYESRRYEGMVNIPIVGDKFDIRIAGEWTKRDGYTEDTTLNTSVDGRDLWSGRMSISFKPTEDLQANLVWEHFNEDDDRLRSGKQLCKTNPFPTTILGINVAGLLNTGGALGGGDNLSQGCELTSLYSKDAFEVPNGYALPYYSPLTSLNVPLYTDIDPYAETTQSTNLRSIQSAILPTYRANNDIVEFNVDYKIDDALTFSSQTGFNHDFLRSTEDYNRFDTAPGIFDQPVQNMPQGIVYPDPEAGKNGVPATAYIFCDPQLGCSDRLIAEDLSEEHAWQASQEFRLASSFSGPFNFSVGANYLHYETEENYYVFINSLSLAAAYLGSPPAATWNPNGTTNQQCIWNYGGYAYLKPSQSSEEFVRCIYIDPNHIGDLNSEGHNYFLSQNPYILNSYAMFGEAYLNLTPDLKLTTGLRWTDDQKHFTDIPSEVLTTGYGYSATAVVNQQWDQWTGREVVDWTPTLPFTDQSLFYASFAHGYKAGGANPPGPVFPLAGDLGEVSNPIHPLTFKPEFIEAFEAGTKQELLDQTLTLNGDLFYYNYTGYQISEIVDRTSINLNFNAHVEGAELESVWEPLPGLKFNFAGGWEDTSLAGGSKSVDLMDRTAGNPNWMVVEPFPTEASNCIIPKYVVLYELQYRPVLTNDGIVDICDLSYHLGLDPVTESPYVANPTTNASGNPISPGVYPGFNPATAPNNGAGFDKDLSHNALPNAPPYTVSFGAQYSMPVAENWAATLRGDFYFQADSWARVFNDNPYDRLRGYTNLNLALILNSADGWQVMGYVKNVFNTTAITGDFLNSDDTGLTTNVFLTDPRLYGIRVTKNFGEGDTGAMADVENYIADLFADKDGGRPPLWIEFGAQSELVSELGDPFAPPFTTIVVKNGLGSMLKPQEVLAQSIGGEAKVSYQAPDSDWIFAASIRYGRASARKTYHYQTKEAPKDVHFYTSSGGVRHPHSVYTTIFNIDPRVADEETDNHEFHSIVDFQAGQDVGLGKFTEDSTAVLSAGVRFVQFMSRQGATLHADPDYAIPSNILTQFIHHHTYVAQSDIKHTFKGVGPSISWTGSVPITGDPQGNGIDVDWGVNGAVLFGRQRTQGHHGSTSFYFRKLFINPLAPITAHASGNPDRSKTVVVPDVGGMFGVSYRFANAKLSLGYRADFFFGAMDAGVDTSKSATRGFYGPFASVSFGLGG